MLFQMSYGGFPPVGLEPTPFKTTRGSLYALLVRARPGWLYLFVKRENQTYKLQEQLKGFRVYHSATARLLGLVGLEPT